MAPWPGSPEEEHLLREHTIRSVMSALHGEVLLWRGKNAVKEEVIKPQYDASKVPAAIARILHSSGLAAEIKTFAYRRILDEQDSQHRRARLVGPGRQLPPLPVPIAVSSTLDSVEWARQRWGYVTLANLRELSREQNQPFLQPRKPPRDDGSPEEVATRHIVDLEGLYHLLTTEMQGQARPACGGLASRGLHWSALGVQLHADTLEVIRERYRDLALDGHHLGGALDDGPRGPGADLAQLRLQEGQALLQRPYTPQLHVFARFGVPPSLRREVWAKCLSAQQSASRHPVALAVQEVAQGICEWEWITDDCLRLDVTEHCANDVCFFPFDEIVEAMVLALSRDPTVLADCVGGPPHIPVAAGAEADGGHSSRPRFLPPSGIVPFNGFSFYACPFAMVCEKLETVYPIFRAFYCQYLCRLHAISTHPGSLLPLCALFESLVFTAVPHVCLHLIEMGPRAAPLRFAFPWIARAFSGFLRVDQVLWLWDRVLGFDSTELIAVLAAAVFIFRSKLVLNARSPEDVELVFSDITALQAVPLLQHFLSTSEDIIATDL